MSTDGRRGNKRGNREGSYPLQRPDGIWKVNLRYTDALGVPKRISIYGKTAALARERAKEARKRIEGGLPPKDAKATVADYCETWIGSSLAASDRKETTKDLYRHLARKHIAAAGLGRLPMDRVKPSSVEAWTVELRGRDLAQSTIRSAYAVLRAIFEAAVRDRLLGTNPAAQVARPKVDRHEADFLTSAEVGALLEAAEGSRYQDLFILIVSTGLRRGEALALTLDRINRHKNVIEVRGTLARVEGELTVTPPKTAKSRRDLPISPAVDVVLHRLRKRQLQEQVKAGSQWAGSRYVFTTELGGPCDPRNALRALKSTAEKARLPSSIGLHTLRHSAATVMLEAGVPLKAVSELLGHSSVAITGDVYGHVSDDAAARAMATLGEALAR